MPLPIIYPGQATKATNMVGGTVRVGVWMAFDGSTPASAASLWTDVTDDVLDTPGISTSQGRSTQLSQFSAGTATFGLLNQTRKYEPGYSSGTYYPYIQPGVPVMIRVLSGTTAGSIFYGWVESWQPDYDFQYRSIVTVSCVDAFGYLANRVIGSSAYAVDVLNDSPQAWYRLGEGSGTTAYDSSGQQRNGTYTGTTAWTSSLVAGDSDQALSAVAADVKANLPSGAKVVVPYTVEAWVVVKATEAQRIIWIQESSACLSLCCGSAGVGAYLVFNDALGSGTEVCAGVPISTGTHHVAVTRTGGAMRFYIDGVESTGAIDRGVRLPAGATETNLAKAQASPTAPAFSNKTNGTGVTVTAPTASAGDLIVVGSYNGTALTGGFTLISAIGLTSFWYKIAGAAEPASWTLTGSNISWAACTYTGCVNVSDAVRTATTQAGGPTTGALTVPGISVEAVNSILINCTGDGNIAGVTIDADFTTRASASTTGSAINIGDKTHAGGTTVDASNAGFTSAGSICVQAFAAKPLGTPYSSTLDEVAIYGTELSATRIAAHYTDSTTTAWTGDTTGARVGRILDAVGWPTARRDIDTGVNTMGAENLSTGQTALAAMQVCETAEQGRLFIDSDGKVAFRAQNSASNRSNESAVQTIWTD